MLAIIVFSIHEKEHSGNAKNHVTLGFRTGYTNRNCEYPRQAYMDC